MDVGEMHADMVGNEIENQTESSASTHRSSLEAGIAAKLRIDLGMMTIHSRG